MTLKNQYWEWVCDRNTNRADREILSALETDDIEISRSYLQKLIASNAVLKNQMPLKASDHLKIDDVISINFPTPESLEILPENIPVEILYEDEDLLFINKPQGLTVHPSATQKSGTLVNALLYQVKDLSGIGGISRPGIVHRLDKDTSGVMVVSKSDRAHRALVGLFSRHELERRYWALCYGEPASELNLKNPYILKTLIGRNPKDRKKMTTDLKTGREAVSEFKLLENFSPYGCLIEAKLQTGRTHQVRVHLTKLGNSLFGDPLYGTPTSQQKKWKILTPKIQTAVNALPGQALHARSLAFAHPITKKWLAFETPPPRLFTELHEALKYG